MGDGEIAGALVQSVVFSVDDLRVAQAFELDGGDWGTGDATHLVTSIGARKYTPGTDSRAKPVLIRISFRKSKTPDSLLNRAVL